MQDTTATNKKGAENEKTEITRGDQPEKHYRRCSASKRNRESNQHGSALECMELETEAGWQVTTCRVNPITRDCESVKRECNIKRITPLTVTVEIWYEKANIEVSYLAEGWIDGKEFLAKVTAFAIWENGWYVWENATDTGKPEAPYSQTYVNLFHGGNI